MIYIHLNMAVWWVTHTMWIWEERKWEKTGKKQYYKFVILLFPLKILGLCYHGRRSRNKSWNFHTSVHKWRSPALLERLVYFSNVLKYSQSYKIIAWYSTQHDPACSFWREQGLRKYLLKYFVFAFILFFIFYLFFVKQQCRKSMSLCFIFFLFSGSGGRTYR